jgi:hypothetical protein
MALTRRQVMKVCEDAGYNVIGIEQAKHFHITVERGGRIASITASVSPRSSFWPTWLIADIKRAMRESA